MLLIPVSNVFLSILTNFIQLTLSIFFCPIHDTETTDIAENTTNRSLIVTDKREAAQAGVCYCGWYTVLWLQIHNILYMHIFNVVFSTIMYKA